VSATIARIALGNRHRAPRNSLYFTRAPIVGTFRARRVHASRARTGSAIHAELLHETRFD
jgi:hypothetical protein